MFHKVTKDFYRVFFPSFVVTSFGLGILRYWKILRIMKENVPLETGLKRNFFSDIEVVYVIICDLLSPE